MRLIYDTFLAMGGLLFCIAFILNITLFQRKRQLINKGKRLLTQGQFYV